MTSEKKKPRLNAAWHARHPMPKNATLVQRVRWHRNHARHCGCRPIPPPLVALVNAAERRFRDETLENPLRRFLSGGDRRSIAGSAKARARIERNPALVKDLVSLTRDREWLVQLRALDLLEKLAHDHEDWVEPYKRVFIGSLAESDKWEMRLQIVRALPLFRWTPTQQARAEEILLASMDHPQKFVRAWALDSLAQFTTINHALRPLVGRWLDDFERSGSLALVTRARKIREHLPSEASRGVRSR